MRPRLAVLGTAALLAVAGCQSDSGASVSATTPAPVPDVTTARSPAPTETAAASPSSSTGSTAPAASPEPTPKRTSRTSVNPSHPERTLTGSGARLIKVDLRGDFGLALDLDCSACRGRVVLTQPGRLTPWVDQHAPVSGQYVVSIMKADHHPSVIVKARGRWKLRLYDWNRSVVRTGTVRGTGSAIFYLDSRAAALRYGYRPADADDALSIRAPGTKEGQMQVFGTDERTRARRVELDLPALIIVHTRGRWTISPSK